MRRLVPLLALALTLAACSSVPPIVPPTLPTLVDTTTGIVGIHVGGTADGPSLLRTASDELTFENDLYTDTYAYAEGGARPDWIPSSAVAYWGLTCPDGIEEAMFFDTELTDAWDGSYISVGGDIGVDIAFGDGTLYEFDDGTLVLSCPSTESAEGLDVTRHMIVPGAATDGRFVVEVLEFAATAPGGFDLGLVSLYLNDGADDSDAEPWEDRGTIGAFEWATKDSNDLGDPAIGLIPLVSTSFTVDTDNTGGDEYYLAGTGTLAQGARTAVAFVAGIRGGFAPDSAVAKDAAMVALGNELAELDGGALCATPRPDAYVWASILDEDGAIADELCAGWDALN